MKHADLYIFDDSFSALDFKTEAALRHALQDETLSLIHISSDLAWLTMAVKPACLQW